MALATTLYASFNDVGLAEKAAGALMDHGVEPDDLSLVMSRRTDAEGKEVSDAELSAKQGISTTTVEDAGSAVGPGAAIGAAAGTIAAIAAITVPGVGLVVGGGALALAVAGAAGAAVGGGLAGGVVGYLVDQGVDKKAAEDYDRAVKEGGAILSVSLPSGGVGESVIQDVLTKYSAASIVKRD